MPVDDPKSPSPLEKMATEAGKAAAVSGLERAATSALDAVEKLLFGTVGGAEEVVRREATADPLERLRAEYNAGKAAEGGVEPPAPPKEDPTEVARRQLEELKRARAARQAAADAGEVKKTL